LGEPDEKPFRPADVAEPIRVFVLDHFADELRAALAEPGERLVDVVHGEHDAEVAESVHRGVPVIGDHRRREKARELEPAVAVRRAHHGDLDALVAQSSDAPAHSPSIVARPSSSRPSSRKKSDRGIEVIDDDADVVHPLKRETHTHPQEIIHVGDSLHNDVGGAQAVGIRAIWVNRHQVRNETSIQPFAETTELSELPDVLAQRAFCER
jgi:hypothetical protein